VPTSGQNVQVDTAEVVVVGAGAAGLSLACRLGEQGAEGVVLVAAPPGPHAAPERTWCSWGSDDYWADAVSARWDRVSVQPHGGIARTYALAPLDYTMIRSRDYERVAGARLARAAVRRIEAVVSGIEDTAAGAVVHGAGLTARWVFDTRPTPPARPGRVALLQHFRGWFVRTREDFFDPAVAGLMDFRPPQPPHGVAFGYVLPTSPREALVEYTEFSRNPLTTAQYEAALADYAVLLGLPAYDVVGADRQGQQAITHVGGDLDHDDADVLGHGRLQRVGHVDLAVLVGLAHGGPLLDVVSWRTPNSYLTAGAERGTATSSSTVRHEVARCE